jgi:hypothetical protein
MSREYGGFLSEQRYKLIEQSLILLSTYFGSEDSFYIHNSETAVAEKGKNISDYDEITQYIQARFLLAKWLMLKDIIGEIDASITSSYEPQVVDYIGKIQGTLVVSQYIQKKWNNVLEKRYPCLVSCEDFDTPENAFLYRILRWAYESLRRLSLPSKRPENNLNTLRQKALLECANMYRHQVFNLSANGHFKSFSLNNLYLIVKKRNSRGQTGNVRKYSALLKWYETLSWSEVVSHSPEKLLLVFGQGSEVWDKIFEIWVLTKIIDSLTKRGYKASNFEANLLPLTKRLQGPIANLSAADLRINFYYQNSDLLSSKWYYEGDKELRGIPDIIVKLITKDTIITVLVDVKNIFYGERADGNTEKYKMMGYFESFRDSLDHQPVGILIFRNDNKEASDFLFTRDGAQLFINTVSPELNDSCFDSITDHFFKLLDNHPKTKSSILQHATESKIVTLSQQAHELAQNLSAKKPEELLRCKDELKRHVFPTTWDCIPGECQTLLGMAELLYQNLQQQLGTDPDVDWGPAILEYCRAAEHFLNYNVIIPFINTQDFNQLIRSLPENRNARAYLYINKGTLTFGELSRFFMDIRNSNDGIFLFIQSCEYLNNDLRFWKTKLWRDLTEVNVKFRRKAAHIDLLKYNDVVKCRSIIIGSSENRGLITQLITKKGMGS